MSTEVDSRIVEMKFDSKDFEKNAQSTLSILDKLKAKLNFSDTKESFNSFDTSKLRKELDKINDFDSGKFESVFDRLEYRMSNMGIFTSRIVENIADDIYNLVKKAMDNIGKIVTFAEQGIVQGGYNRAANIQSAKFQLEGLGIKWSEIYGDIDYAVTNTAYSLDQAAIVASQLASSGIKPGGVWKDLSGKEQDIDYMAMILRSISGTASATGGKADYADIGRIFTKMLSYGKVYTQNLNELATYGIGAKGIVADYLNQIKYKGSDKWTEQRVQDVMSDRQGGGLDPQIVIEAFFNKFADHATAANETLTGVTANLRAALARIGEKFFEPIIKNGGPLVKLIDALRISINDLNKVIGPVAESFGKYIGGLIEKFTDNWFFETTTDPETGEQKRTMKLGGIFSSFMEPWKESEWLPTKIGEGERRQGLNLPTEYLQNYETRAQKIAGNLRDIVKNIVSIVTGVGKLFGSAFKGATDSGFSLAAVLVTITNFLNKLTKTIADFVNAPEFVNSGIYLFFRFLADSVRIMISFAKSFKKHIIDPIFNAGKAAASATGVGSWFRDLFDRIHNFSLKLREEGNEDYFGPFLEKIKAGAKAVKEKLNDLFGGIGTTVKNGMRDIIDWWKPIKDIIFDTDLGFKDKMAAIKQYFSENFELPGWSKVKDIFGGIADAVGKAFNAVKKFLGFGGKDEGIPNPDEYELVASKHDFSGVLGIQSELEKADKSTEKLTTIGDRLSNFFTKVGEAFSNVELGGIKGVTLALLAIVILLAVGIALAVKKVLDSMKKLVIDFPKLASDILKSFQGVMDEVAAMFKAKKYEIYTQALKNIAIATAMLTAVFIGLAGIIAIVDHFGGGDEMADGLKQAGIVIAGIAGSLTVMLAAIIAVTNLTGGGTGYALGISKSGLNASAPSASLAAVAAVIKSFVDGIVALAAVVVVLGALSYIPGLLDSGFDALDKIILRLSIFILGVISLVGVINLISAWNHEFKSGKTWIAGNQAAFAKSLAAIAGILMSIVAGVLILTPVIAVLGILSKVGLFDLGIDALMHITGWLALTTATLLIIVAVISKVGQLDGKRIAGAIFGLAAVITAVTLGVLAFSAAMVIVSRLDGSGFAKSVFAFGMIAAALIGIPAALMAIYNHMSKANILRFDNKVLGSMTLMVLAIGASVLAMSIGLRAAASSDPLSLLITVAGIAGIFGTIAAVMYNLARFDKGGLTKAAITIGVMGGVIIALNTMLIILSHHLTMNMLIAGAIMIGEVILLAGAIFGLSKFLNRFGSGLDFTGLVQFAGAMALVAASILPISAALYIVMAAVGGFSMNVGQIVAAMGGMALLVGVLVFAVTRMLEHIGRSNIKDRNLKAIAVTILSMSAALALVAASLAVVFAAISSTELSELGSIGIMLAFGAVIVAFGYALQTIINSLSKIKDAKKLIAPLAVTIAAIVIPLAAIAGSVALLSVLPLSGVIAGGVVLFAMSGLCLWLSDWIMDMGRGMRWSENLAKKIELSLASYATITVSMVPLASALTLIAKQSVGKIWNAVAVLTVMGYAVAGMSAIVIAIGNRIKDVQKSLTSIGSFVGIAVSICAIALVLDKLRGFDFDEIKDALLALGVVAGAAIAIAALFGLVSKMGKGAEAAAGMLLSIAVVMASVGVLLWLSAEALDKFVDVLLKIDGKMGTITSSLTGLLIGLVSAIGAALKQAIIGLANAASDPEILTAISNAVTSILTWVRDNIGVWTQLIIQIATSFVKAIVDAIDLEEMGKWIDDKFLGGQITTTIDALVKVQYDVALSDAIGDWTNTLWAKSKEIFTKGYGFTDDQWEILRDRYATQINSLVQFAIEAYALGDKEARDKIESMGGVYSYFGNMLKGYANKLGLVAPTEMETNISKVSELTKEWSESIITLRGATLKLEDLNIELPNLPQIETELSDIGSMLQKVLVVGWESQEGQDLLSKIETKFNDILRKCDDEETRKQVYNLMYLLGFQVPEGYKDGIGLYDDTSLIDWFTAAKLALGKSTKELLKLLGMDKEEIEDAYKEYYQAGTAAERYYGTTETPIPKKPESTPVKPSKMPNAKAYKSTTKVYEDQDAQDDYLIGSGKTALKLLLNQEDYGKIHDWKLVSSSENWTDDVRKGEYSANLRNYIQSTNLVNRYFSSSAEQQQQFVHEISNLVKSGEIDMRVASQILQEELKGSGHNMSEIWSTIVGDTQSNLMKLAGTLSANSGKYVDSKMSYITFSGDLTKNYFNPLQVGMSLGYSNAANGGINSFTSTMNTAGSVLGASRPYVESSILSGFINPLGTFMQAGGTTDGNMYKNSLLTVLNAGFTVTPRVSVVPEISMAGNSFMEGLGMGSSMANPIVQYINQSMGLNDVYTSPFRWSGEMITAGLMYGMQDSTSRKTVKENTKTLSMTVVNYIKQAFKIHSPAKDEELIWASEMVVAGFSNGMTNKASSDVIKAGADGLADLTDVAINDSMSNIDVSDGGGLGKAIAESMGDPSSILDGFDIGSVAGKLKNAITEKLPTWGFIQSQFGWDKGISGNIQGLKNVWGSIKDAFSGGLDLEGILKDSGLDVSKFTAGLNLENMGFSISANDIIDMQGINNEFAGFDVNDYTTNTDLSVKLDLDTSMADDWLKQNQSIDMATSIPVTGGYERSTTGSTTYVNNYSFNQNNTSPQALSARDTARYAELMLNRRLGWRAQ